MNAHQAFAQLRRLGVSVVTTSDASALLKQSVGAASQTLTRLASAGLVTLVRHGVWWIKDGMDLLLLPEHLTAPLPSYVSMHTALHHHGMIEQIPEVVYAASLARTQRIRSRVGVFSIHHLAPEVFGGFEELANGIKLASPEKALFDFAYLSGGRSRLFTSLPELMLPARFRTRELLRWIEKIPSARSRTLTKTKLDAFMATGARAHQPTLAKR